LGGGGNQVVAIARPKTCCRKRSALYIQRRDVTWRQLPHQPGGVGSNWPVLDGSARNVETLVSDWLPVPNPAGLDVGDDRAGAGVAAIVKSAVRRSAVLMLVPPRRGKNWLTMP